MAVGVCCGVHLDVPSLQGGGGSEGEGDLKQLDNGLVAWLVALELWVAVALVRCLDALASETLALTEGCVTPTACCQCVTH